MNLCLACGSCVCVFVREEGGGLSVKVANQSVSHVCFLSVFVSLVNELESKCIMWTLVVQHQLSVFSLSKNLNECSSFLNPAHEFLVIPQLTGRIMKMSISLSVSVCYWHLFSLFVLHVELCSGHNDKCLYLD